MPHELAARIFIGVSTAVEIEQAIETLSPAEYAKLLAWLDERRAAEVDARFEAAVLAGRFDALAQRADNDLKAGHTVPLEDFLREGH